MMKLSFQHANPDSGNESVLLRFDGAVDGPAPCVLVDAGDGTDVDSLLGPDDRLAAICLTHAHLDHYGDLPRTHRRGIPVYTSPPTAAVLGDVFDVAGEEYGVDASDILSQAIEPVDEWTAIVPGVELCPVPVGHAPGAAGFLFRLDDGNCHHVLVTGDFTRRQAGAYPGLAPESLPEIDALFLTGATDDTFEANLTDGLGRALEAAHGGSRTLLATSGLFGVQCAVLLATLSAKYDLGVSVRAVGQVAKLYDALGYDVDVDLVPEFESPSRCLDPGVVTVAGPEIPRERSSGRLFDDIQDDPGACVVQLVGSGLDPVSGASCIVHNFACSNHPDRETLTAVHDAVDPVQTVILHTHGGAGDQFNDLDSVVWGSGDVDEYTLYDGDGWRLPPWMGGGRLSRHGARLGDVADLTALDSLGVPAVARRDEIDPAAEGVDTDRIEALLHRRADAGSAGETARSASATDRSADAGSTDASERRVSVSDGGTEDQPSSTDSDDTRAVDVSPFTSLLVDQAAEELSPDAFVNEAVDAYVLALLSGEVTGDETLSVDVSVDPAGDDLLRDATADAGFDSLSAAVIDGIETALDADSRTVYLAADQWALMDAAVTNDGYAFTDYTGFVDAAVARALAT